MHVLTDRTFAFDADPARFWEAIGSVDDYTRWWPWLHTFEARELSRGEVWHCTVKPPLPYSVTFDIHLDHVAPERSIEATVTGDIEGTAHLEVRPDGPGCVVRLRSALAPTSLSLRVVATLGRPFARYGHDWVLDIGAGQFASRAL
jgi:hypothetical protein